MNKENQYIHTMEYYSVLKRQGILTYATTGIKLENVMLSEIASQQGDKYRMIPLT